MVQVVGLLFITADTGTERFLESTRLGIKIAFFLGAAPIWQIL